MDQAISPSNGKSLAEDMQVMKAYSLAVATKADYSEPDEEVSFGTETERRYADQEKEDNLADSSYSTEKNEEEDSIGQLVSSASTGLGKSAFGNGLGGLFLAQNIHHINKPQDVSFV